MTAQVTVAALMFTLGIFGLACWHAYHRWDRDHRTKRQVAERWDAQLALVGQLVPLREVDEAYAAELVRVGERMAAPFDYELSGFGVEGLRQVLEERQTG